MGSAELEPEAPAIKALGSLFKLTQVYFWDEILLEKQEGSGRVKRVQEDAVGSSTTDGDHTAEEMELSRQLNELGLPLSFHTNKDRNGKRNGKRNDTTKNHWLTHEATMDNATAPIKVSEQEIVSPTIIHDNMSCSLGCMSMLCQSESSYCGIAVDDKEIQCPTAEEEFLMASAGMITPPVSEDFISADEVSEVQCGQGCDSINSTRQPEIHMKAEAVSVHVDEAPSGSSLIYYHGIKDHVECLVEHVPLKDLSMSAGHALRSDTNITSPQDPRVGAQSDLLDDYEKIDGERKYDSGVRMNPHVGAQSDLSDDFDMIDGESNYDSGDWMTYWDSYYSRNYFYNHKTQESTWEPPPGVKHLAFGDATNESDEIVTDMIAGGVSIRRSSHFGEQPVQHGLHQDLEFLEQSRNDNSSVEQIFDEARLEVDLASDASENCLNTSPVNEPPEISRSNDEGSLFLPSDTQLQISSMVNDFVEDVSEELCDNEECSVSTDYVINKFVTEQNTATKRKKKGRRTRSHRKSSTDNEELLFEGILEEFSPSMNKYWFQRYLLFSKYDNGIKMDEEGWFSVTPESIAKHHASRCGGGTVVDCFTGVGGNAIQFAQTSIHVIAIDIDPKKIEYAQHNASIYGVDDLIEFIRADTFILAPKLKADTVFLSPPWGGPDYAKVKTFDIKSMLRPLDGYALFNVAKQIAPRIVMFLPRNVDLNQLAELSLSVHPPWSLEVEESYLNGKLKAITAYYSDPLVYGTSSSSS